MSTCSPPSAPAGPPAPAPAGATDPAAPSAIGPEHLAAVARARRRGRAISRAAGIATFSGWSMICFAVPTILFGLFSLPALLLGAGLIVTARCELAGARRLRRLDLAAPPRLAMNQLAVAGILAAYAAWGVFRAVTGPGRYAEVMAAGGPLAEAMEPIDRLHTLVAVLFYVALIGFTVVAQGAMATYYLTRQRPLHDYLTRTPPWIVDMLRVAAA